MVSATLAGMIGWQLHQQTHRQVQAAPAIDMSRLPERRLRNPDAFAVLRLLDEWDSAPWQRWKRENALPLTWQTRTIGPYLTQAVAILLADGRLTLPGTLSAEDQFLATRLRTAIGEIEPLLYNVVDGVIADRLGHAHEQLDLLIERLHYANRETLARTPIAASRVDAFNAALDSTISGGPRLTDFLPGRSLEPLPVTRAVGMEFIVARQYFVLADAPVSVEDLGRQIGAGMLRMQDRVVIDSLRDGSPPGQASLRDLGEMVDRLASTMADPRIIYFGHFEIADALDWGNDATEVRLRGLPAFASFLTIAPREHLVLLDVATAPAFHVAAEEGSALRSLPSGLVATIVRELPDDREADEPCVFVETGQVVSWTPTEDTRAHFIVVEELVENETPGDLTMPF